MVRANVKKQRGMGANMLALLQAAIIGLTVIFLVMGCSSGSSETPESIGKSFLVKHIPLMDLSVSDYYVMEEQASVREVVQKHIDALKQNGAFDSAQSTKYDFSNITLKVIGQKSMYVNDQPHKFLEFEAGGSYTQTEGGKTRTINEDEKIILESVRGQWKVTEKNNPWK